MTLIKYLANCFLAFLDFFNPPCLSKTKDILIGLFVIVTIIATFVLTLIFISWIYAIIITIGGMIIFCVLSVLIELIIKAISRNK